MTTSLSSTTERIIRLLLLETLEWGWGINLGWQMGDRGGLVILCSTGCDSGPRDIGVGGEHRHLLHQQLLLLVKLFIVQGKLLERSVDLAPVGFKGCRGLL
jgi:hypothetical protein